MVGCGIATACLALNNRPKGGESQGKGEKGGLGLDRVVGYLFGVNSGLQACFSHLCSDVGSTAELGLHRGEVGGEEKQEEERKHPHAHASGGKCCGMDDR